MVDSPFTTPKRKRSEMLSDDALRLNTTTQFTFDVNSAAEDGNASPRTRVAHRFRGLALGSGGGGNRPQAESSAIDNDAEDSSRKRIKLPDVEMTDADSPPAIGLSASLQGSPSGRRPSLKSAHIALDDAVVSQSERVAHTGTDDDNDNDNDNDNDDNNTKNDKESNLTPTPLLNPPSPSPIVTSRPHPQPRTKKQRAPWKKRAGTPPFPARSKSLPSSETTTTATGSTTTTTTTTITDPLRASLTWQDDEITIYDPDDSDDDGTGINGIGFKPTPAIAYARAVRRRQQLAEYRKREEREARAKRSARRRAGGGSAGSLAPEGARLLAGDVLSSGAVKKAKAERRKVRFLEREGAEMIGV
ncbi:hypothetical protein C7999DRAFT_39584 [Corynascus novoguineensis]|uniref:Uncharacterized protein n=1 Tax=Corynascus novoguineensis TaxID=1126955 RepID=A0AAN7CVT6_9PEZI|nr:hypothetical protein C7999DRAFT_39584 [Corynascus novoguineensis]